MSERERRIREIAYLLWEQEGRPDGQSERFWHTAETQYEAESAMTGDEERSGSEASVSDPLPEAESVLADVAEIGAADAAPGAPMFAPAVETDAPPAKAAEKPAAKAKAAPKSAKAKPAETAAPAEPATPRAKRKPVA